MTVPKSSEMFEAALDTLRELGGSANIEELEERVSQRMDLSEDTLAVTHKGSRSKFSYNLAWTRTYLKNAGLVENTGRGIWALTNAGQRTTQEPDHDSDTP